MENVNITINGQAYAAPKGSTVLEAAALNGVRIPTLCHLKDLDPRANCRMCVVQIEKFRTFQPACATCINEGMVINTDTPEVRAARKLTLELILSDHAVDCHHCMRIGSSKCDDLDPKFCEMCFFCDCVRDGFCELQSLAREYKVDALPFEQRGFDRPLDESTGSIIRNPNKCIKCRRCVDVCNDIQTVHNLCNMHRGTETVIVPALNRSMAESPCVQCGRCVEVCPTGAIFSLEHKDELLYNTHKYSVTTVAQISRNVLPALAELFKMDAEPDIRLVAAGLRKIGVDFVVSDDFALTEVQKQANEAIERALKAPDKPVVLTNSPAAEKFATRNFPDVALTTYPSAQQFFGDYVRTVFANENNLDAKTIKTISVTNDNENAAEAHEMHSVDFVVNAHELYRIFLRTGVDLKKRRPARLDSFGVSEPDRAGFLAPNVWTIKANIRSFDLYIDGKDVRAADAPTLGTSRLLLDEVKSCTSPYQLLRLNA